MGWAISIGVLGVDTAGSLATGLDVLKVEERTFWADVHLLILSISMKLVAISKSGRGRGCSAVLETREISESQEPVG